MDPKRAARTREYDTLWPEHKPWPRGSKVGISEGYNLKKIPMIKSKEKEVLREVRSRAGVGIIGARRVSLRKSQVQAGSGHVFRLWTKMQQYVQ